MQQLQPSAFKWPLFIFLICSTYLITATCSLVIPRMSPIVGWEITLQDPPAVLATDSAHVKTYYYNQTLDHFNYRPQSYQIFNQRYMINFKYWGGPNSSAPIFVYLGAEAAIDDVATGEGLMTDNAASFAALLVYIEHRYYGKSIPFESTEEAFKNASTLGYFNSAQAIADYAEVILHIKKTYNCKKCPVIVYGGSYGGMLAAWFRLKYPHVAIGALASSAPLLDLDRITPRNGYFSIVTRVFREASETCYETIRKSWSEIERIASQPNGLSLLSQKFNTCQPLNQSGELVNHLEVMYAQASQYNYPPRYPVNVICGGIDGASSGSDILSKIYAGIVAYTGNDACKVYRPTETETYNGWNWQTCTEIMIRLIKGNDTMFTPEPFDFKRFALECKKDFGVHVTPRRDWVSSYYGGHDIKLVFKRFGSNIIFSNGLKDPYSYSGIVDNISDSLVAVTSVNGSHCMDLMGAKETDPQWLVEQRKKEIEIMKGWLTQYYADLGALKWTSKFQSKP